MPLTESYFKLTQQANCLQADAKFWVVEQQQLASSQCPCCDNEIRNYRGEVQQQQQTIARYWLNLPEGHDAYFMLAIALQNDNAAKIALLLGWAGPTRMVLTIA